MISSTFRSLSRTNKAAVLLSGCGVYDGSEIHESTSVLIHLSKLGISYECFSLNKSYSSVNHTNGKPHDPRNLLEESARISRGQISPISSINPRHFDTMFIPGGFGAAKNFSDYASKGAEMEVDPEVASAILSFYYLSKPIGAICIAPIILAKVLGTTSRNRGIDLTLGKKGSEWPYAESIEVASRFGNKVVSCDVDDVCKDVSAKIVTTPGYMKEGVNPFQVYTGIGKLVEEVLKLVNT